MFASSFSSLSFQFLSKSVLHFPFSKLSFYFYNPSFLHTLFFFKLSHFVLWVWIFVFYQTLFSFSLCLLLFTFSATLLLYSLYTWRALSSLIFNSLFSRTGFFISFLFSFSHLRLFFLYSFPVPHPSYFCSLFSALSPV